MFCLGRIKIRETVNQFKRTAHENMQQKPEVTILHSTASHDKSVVALLQITKKKF
jgi:hypothetical protein